MRHIRYSIIAPVVYLAAVLDTSVVDVMRIGRAAPDLLALTAVVWLLTTDRPRAFLVAGGIALVGDLIAPGRVGVGMAWMLLVGYGVVRLRLRFKTDHVVWQIGMTWAAVTAWALAVGFSGRLLGDVSASWATILQGGTSVGLYTAGVSLPVWMVIGWIREPRLARERKLAQL